MTNPNHTLFRMPRDMEDAAVRVAQEVAFHTEYSHSAAADIFAKMHVGHVLWCYDMGKWLVWNGTRWEMDAERMVAGAINNFTAVYAAVAAADDRLGAQRRSTGRIISSAPFFKGMLQLLQAQELLWCSTNDLDKDPWLLNCKNGVLNLKSGVLMDHDPKYRMTKVAEVKYNPDAKAPQFEKFLGEVFMGDDELIKFVKHTLGYCTTGDTSIHALYFWHGDGRNGKSTLGELVARILGDYARKISASVVATAPSERHPTELAQLRGIRLAFSSEVDRGAYWNESRIKELTGDQQINARFMRQDFFTFDRTHKHLIYGNSMPRLRVADTAMAARFKLVEFAASFMGREDALLPDKLDSEREGVLSWMVDGAMAVWAAGCKLPKAAAQEQASDTYMTESDSFQAWIDENLVEKEGIRTRANMLYTDYREWKQSRGEMPESIQLWSQLMKKRFRRIVSSKIPFYADIGMKFEGSQHTTNAPGLRAA